MKTACPPSRCFRLWIPILTALLLRLAITPFNQIEGLMDPGHVWEYGNVARSLVTGHGYGSPFNSMQPSAIMPPLFSFVVALFYKLFGIHTPGSIFAVHAFNCLLSALSCLPIYLMARRSFGERAGRVAAWAWAVFPYGIYFAAAWAWSTHILLFCLCWLLVLAQKMELSSSLRLWAGFGALAGLAGLAEPSVLAVVPFLMLLALWRLWRARLSWFLPGLTASILLLAVISPWMIRNAMVFHRFIPMRDSMALELWVGNHGNDIRFTDDDNHPLYSKTEIALYDSLGELRYMELKSRQFHAFVEADRGHYYWMCARRFFYLWTGFWSLDPVYLAIEPFALANIPFATALTLLGLLGLGIAWRRAPREALRYSLVLLLFPLIYCFAHPEPYHMRPLDPILLLLACYGVLTLLAARKNKGARQSGS